MHDSDGGWNWNEGGKGLMFSIIFFFKENMDPWVLALFCAFPYLKLSKKDECYIGLNSSVLWEFTWFCPIFFLIICGWGANKRQEWDELGLLKNDLEMAFKYGMSNSGFHFAFK